MFDIGLYFIGLVGGAYPSRGGTGGVPVSSESTRYCSSGLNSGIDCDDKEYLAAKQDRNVVDNEDRTFHRLRRDMLKEIIF
jgi:hypothetical protein